ncbi:enoyl-CoA hydratase/isomerase family protein [Streptomyces cinereoruber]|uniref:enoyl-CoA hydratase/isomerase family protein n=1 Tax=Streptomyces cinereoruber TaxID=67260 RepID=UPI0036411570
MPSISRQESVFVIDLGVTENVLSPEWIRRLNEHLDIVDQEVGNCALVVKASGKHWSTGLDLPWVMANLDQLDSYMRSVHHLFRRFLTAPYHTIAAIQGHCYAAGAMLALAHDFRFMRADRGFFCLPEVDLKIPFDDGMTALIKEKLPAQVLIRAMTSGHRFGGAEAESVGIVDSASTEDALLTDAIDFAHLMAPKAGETLAAIKTAIYRNVIDKLSE